MRARRTAPPRRRWRPPPHRRPPGARLRPARRPRPTAIRRSPRRRHRAAPGPRHRTRLVRHRWRPGPRRLERCVARTGYYGHDLRRVLGTDAPMSPVAPRKERNPRTVALGLIGVVVGIVLLLV